MTVPGVPSNYSSNKPFPPGLFPAWGSSQTTMDFSASFIFVFNYANYIPFLKQCSCAIGLDFELTSPCSLHKPSLEALFPFYWQKDPKLAPHLT